MFSTLLNFFNHALFHAGFAYAVFLTLKASHCNKENDSELTTSSAQLSNICITPSTMKLWLMLSTLAALSLLGADYLPLFEEFRVLAMLLIVFSSDLAQVRLYDTVFAPTLVRVSEFWHSPERKHILARTLALLTVRGCIFCAITIMNALRESSYTNVTSETCNIKSGKIDMSYGSSGNIEEVSLSLSPDVIKDVIGGLVFSQQALNRRSKKKSEKTRQDQKEQHGENTNVKIEKVQSTQHCAKSEVNTAEQQPKKDNAKIPNVSDLCTPATEHNKTEHTVEPLKVTKPPLFQGRLEQWLTTHANVQSLRPPLGKNNTSSIRNNGYAASGTIYANHEPAAMERKQYAQSERYCVNTREVNHDVASTTSYSPGAWGAEWYYADRAETLSATEEGVVRHRKRHHHRHTRPHARSNDREESIEERNEHKTNL